MDTDRVKRDIRSSLGWLAEGWRNISSRASHALTYFNPAKAEEEGNPRWGLMAADVAEDDDHVIVAIEAPGLDKDQIDVAVEPRRLIVTGTKRYESDRKEGAMRITERAFGSFQRVIPLPDEVTADGAEASYKRGVLKLKMQKAAPPGARKIAVVAG